MPLFRERSRFQIWDLDLGHLEKATIMRLTLRTLIAYLDDELQADQAKEIGQKLTESGYATALVERIKEVMRRRRLSAPELFGKGAGLDPNLVAEYLDSELTPAEVVDVEKICLDSDMHLAEVAACHQILTLVLGDPVEVRSETRSRMYGLGPVTTSDTVRANDFAGVSRDHESRQIPMIASALNPSHNGTTDRDLPDYLKPQTSWRRTGMLVLVVLIGVGWFSSLLNDRTLRSGSRPDGDSSRSEKPSSVTGGPADNGTGKKFEVATAPTGNQQIAQVDPSVSSKPQNVRVASPKELPDGEPGPDAPPVLDTKPQPAKPANPPEPDVVPAKLMPSQKLSRVSKDGIVLRFEPEAGDFLVLPRVVQLKVGDQLACPEPFRADFMIGDDLCSFALIGGTSVRYLGPDEQSSVGFDIQQGALLFETHGLRAAAENADAAKPQKPSLPITVIFYGQQARLELASNNAVCGIEVRRSEPNNFEVEPAAPGFTASLHVAQGTVRFTTADGKTATVEGPGFLPITSGATANEKRSEIERASLLILPDWLEPDPKRAATKLKRPYNAAFEKEFDAEQLLQLSLPAVVNHPRPALSELAVKCLALTDCYGPLVKALSKEVHREARLAAITGLRQWLPLDPRHRVLLKVELAKHFLPTDAETVYRLLWGFDLDDAKTPATSRSLVGWLDSEQLAVRELAFFHVQKLTGLKHEYSPNTPSVQRRAAVDRWYSHLEKKGGALVQE